MSFYSDTELLSGIANNDSRAINEIYKQYHDILVRWVCTRGGESADAEDAFQDAMVVLYGKAQDPEFCLTCKLSTYLFAVCKRIWLKKRGKNSLFLSVEGNSEESGFQIEAEEQDVALFLQKEADLEKLNEALLNLGEPCAGLIKAFYMEQKSMQEIAGQFKYTNSENAKNQKYKCLKRLRKLFYGEKKEEKIKED